MQFSQQLWIYIRKIHKRAKNFPVGANQLKTVITDVRDAFENSYDPVALPGSTVDGQITFAWLETTVQADMLIFDPLTTRFRRLYTKAARRRLF